MSKNNEVDVKKLKDDLKDVAKGCGLGCGGIILLSIIIVFLSTIFSSDTRTVDKYDAEVFAEDFVKEKLKSPSSAKFSSTSEKDIKEIEDNVWEVSGSVEAENSFGANIKNNFIVEMEYDPDHESWMLNNISIN